MPGGSAKDCDHLEERPLNKKNQPLKIESPKTKKKSAAEPVQPQSFGAEVRSSRKGSLCQHS